MILLIKTRIHNPFFIANDYKDFDISDEVVRWSRRSYFANIRYLDDKIGALMMALAAMRMDKNTIILFCSDHGDMFGERGLWFKLSFFEGAAWVPLIMRILDQSPCTGATPVSNMDVTPPLFDLAFDPDEMQKLAGEPAYANKMAHLTDLMKETE